MENSESGGHKMDFRCSCARLFPVNAYFSTRVTPPVVPVNSAVYTISMPWSRPQECSHRQCSEPLFKPLAKAAIVANAVLKSGTSP